MKDTLDILIKLFAAPRYVAEIVGWGVIGLFFLSRWPEYNFITKYILTLALTH